ncbi:MAG: MaoC/PaaZ C-terminal domain-containing protein [Anaerolineales bacterium]|jgi:acyl dehydratase
MGSNESEIRGKWFEEFEVGMKVTSPGRTVTEADIVNFAGLSGDYNQIHVDAEFSKAQPFKQRVAHGLLVMSIISGLANQTGLIDRTVIAFREIDKWKFSKPVFIGDTVHVVMEVQETKPMSKLNGGVVVLKVNIINQRDEVVQRGEWVVLIHNKPKG